MPNDTTEFRRQLVKTAAMYHEAAETFPVVDGNTRAEAHAHRGSLMAGVYAYGIAAAIKLVEEAHGADAASDLAVALNDILTNGDDGETNADVLPVGRYERTDFVAADTRKASS